jgi:hypothetical protein
MKINIEISKEDCNAILNKYGYVTEEVLVHFNKLESENLVDLGSYYVTVAYMNNSRPQCLDKTTIMIEDIDGMQVENVINKLFTRTLMEKIF